MKKSINIGIILLFLLQACSDQENTKNQTALDKIPEDTPINSPQALENSVENWNYKKKLLKLQLNKRLEDKNGLYLAASL